MIINCKGENLTLDQERALYWSKKKTLVLSDIHIGKSAHFRRSGIPVPNSVSFTDLHRLSTLIRKYRPENLWITGDMFHNKLNSDVSAFLQWKKDFRSLNFRLIKGNHDALKNEELQALDLEINNKEHLVFPFRFTHDQPVVKDEYYNICGHLHPGIVLYGKAKQQLKFPCFYFGQHHAILPAFSIFTGLKTLKPEKGDFFYAITPSGVISV